MLKIYQFPIFFNTVLIANIKFKVIIQIILIKRLAYLHQNTTTA